jgi:hypothetical protein
MTTKISGAKNITNYTIDTEQLSNTATAAFAQSLEPKILYANVASNTYTVINDTVVNVGGGYIVVTGSEFQSGATVLVDTTPASSVTYVSNTTLRVQVPAKSAASYNLYVVNPDGGIGIKPAGITYSAPPTWVTTSPLANVTSNTVFSNTFVATLATSYANTTILPTGFNLLANGYYYGNISVGLATTYSLDIRATDAETQYSDKTFNLNVVMPAPVGPPVTDYVALYTGDTYTGTTTWVDSSGNGYSVTLGGSGYSSQSVTGNGASKTFSVVRGTTSTTMLWPTQILPSTYTLFQVSRTFTNRNRVLTGFSNNWLSGHWNNKSGVAYHQAWGSLGEPTTDYHGTNWMYATDQNDLFRSNGTTRTTYSGGASARMCVNSGNNTETSQFEIAEIIVYNRTLNSTEYTAVETYLVSKYGL